MKNIKKLGYISIELVIVAGVVLAFGLIGVMKFVKQGTQAAGEQDKALTDVYSSMSSMRTNANGTITGTGAVNAGGEGH